MTVHHDAVDPSPAGESKNPECESIQDFYFFTFNFSLNSHSEFQGINKSALDSRLYVAVFYFPYVIGKVALRDIQKLQSGLQFYAFAEIIVCDR